MLDQIASIRVVKARNGIEAVKLYHEDRLKKCCTKFITLVLLDLHMPVLDGFKATEKILAIAKAYKYNLAGCDRILS